jgi:hypothetical protein
MMNEKENATTSRKDKDNAATALDRDARLLRDEELDAVSGGTTMVEQASALNKYAG